MNKGRGAGVTGVVDIQGSPQFGVEVLAWSPTETVSSTDNTGQGDLDLGDSLALIQNGTLILRGQVRRDLFPVPTSLKNSSGVVTFTYVQQMPGSGATDITCSGTYRFESVKINYDEPQKDLWAITLTAVLVGAFTYAGFGAQVTSTARTPGNKYLYTGREKVFDATDLTGAYIVDRSIQVFNVWGVSADTDAQEITSIAAIIAAYTTAPQTHEKTYTATANRLSSTVIKITLVWKQLNSRDEIEVPRHRVTTDPFDLQSVTTSAAVYLISAGPPSISVPSGLKLRSKTSTDITKYVSVQDRNFTKKTTKDDQEMDNSLKFVDVSSVGSHIQIAGLDATPSTPANYALRTVTTKTLNSDHTLTIIATGLRTPAEDTTLPGTFAVANPDLNIGGYGRKIAIFPTGSTPSDPTPPTGLKITSSRTLTLTSANSPTTSEKIWEFGVATPKNKVEWSGTEGHTDPYGLDYRAMVTLISSASQPSTPAAPLSGLQFVSVTNPPQQLTDPASGAAMFRWQFNYKPSTTKDVEELRQTRSYRSGKRPFTDSIGSVIAASGTVASQLNSIFSANATTAFFDGVRLQALNPGYRLATYEYVNPGQLVIYDSRQSPAITWRNNGTNVQMHIMTGGGNLTQGSGKQLVQFTPVVDSSVVRRKFSLVRSIPGTTIPDQNPATVNSITMPYFGSTNGATFLGQVAGSVIYRGCAGRVNIALGSTFQILVRWDFEYQSNGWANGINQRYFSGPIRLTTANTTASGWTNVQEVGLGTTNIIQTHTDSFLAFTS